jgi:hypothetical protein
VTGRFGSRFAIALVTVCGLLAGAASAANSECLVPGVGEPIDRVWQPNMQGAIAYANGRGGDIAFAVRTDRLFYGYRPDHVEWSASVLKAMLLVTYLDQPDVSRRVLNDYDRSLLFPMITQSDNAAASTVLGIVGDGNLWALANWVGMTNFQPASPWGESHITARDQTRFFLHIDNYVSRLHKAYALRMLASVTPSQRWGIGEVAPRNWELYFKGGWGSGTGLTDHQVVLLVRGCARVSIAVLTMYDVSHDYGKETLKGIFRRLLRGFPTQTAEGRPPRVQRPPIAPPGRPRST